MIFTIEVKNQTGGWTLLVNTDNFGVITGWQRAIAYSQNYEIYRYKALLLDGSSRDIFNTYD